jgi:glycosyltransferase involved in cell wall biosynthesis
MVSKWAHPWNGMCQVVHRISRGLLDRGHEVAWVANANEINYSWIDDRIQIVPSSLTLLSHQKFIKNHLEMFDPDIIHAHDSYGIYFLNISPSLLMTSHSNWPRSWFLSIQSFISGLAVEIPQDIVLRRANKAIAVSEYSAKMLSKRGINTNVIYNGVEVGDKSQSPRTGFAAVGTLDKRKFKHLPAIWRAIQERTDAKLDVVGNIISTELAHKLRRLEGVTVHGKVPDITPYYRKNRTLIFPSRAEACPLTLLEAKAHGMPAVAWNICSHSDLLRGRTGEVISPYDIEEFADAAVRLHGADCEDTCLGDARQRFSVSRMVSEYEHAYAQIL